MAKTPKSRTKPEGKVDARRGTPVWGINSLRSDALTHLLDDLVDLEKSGLQDSECDLVQRALKKLTNKATELPDGSFWVTSIHSELGRFENVYIQWNSTDQSETDSHIAHRQMCLKELRKIRHGISKRIRRNQFILQNELDLKFVEDMYDALGNLVTALPDTFKALGQSLARFEARKGAG